MRKSKALSEIRKRKRNGGLIFKPKQEEHPIMLAVKALSCLTEGLILILKTITEAEDPNDMCKQFEKEGVFKEYREAAESVSAAMGEYNEKMNAAFPLPADITATAENE